MDSTFDSLVSKGMLEDIDAFVGSKSGKYRTETEQVKYLDTGNDNVQLTPGIVSDTRITFDDVASLLNNISMITITTQHTLHKVACISHQLMLTSF